MSWRENPRISEIPSHEETVRLASLIGNILIPAYRSNDIDGIAQELEWKLSIEPIASNDGKLSVIEALLVPLRKGNFCVVINSEHQPNGERSLWLLAHEIGHSLFYKADEKYFPRRIIPTLPNEELYCDYFASTLIIELKRE